MLGLIKKDLFMLKNNSKLLVIWIIMIILFSLSGEGGLYIVLPVMGLSLSISSFSYDDYNNWNTYLSALPNGKKYAVKAKYIFSLLLLIFTSIISIILVLILSKNIEEDLSGVLGTVLGFMFLISILFPFIYKFGIEKGRIILIIMCLIIGSGGGIIAKKLSGKELPSFIKYIDEHFLLCSIIATIVIIIIYVVSFIISNKIYAKKEF
jgi:hypothetical protein